jgi:hypothetical protein
MKHFNVNIKCEEKLGELGDATFEDFARCRGDELTSFLFVRDPTISVSKLPKKGKTADAEAGVDVLILRAFSVRTDPILLQDPTQAEQATKQDATHCTHRRMPNCFQLVVGGDGLRTCNNVLHSDLIAVEMGSSRA